MRALLAVTIMLLTITLAGCSDPCWAGPDTPSCAGKKAEVAATMQAIDIEREQSQRAAQMVATKQAIEIKSRATLDAITVRATEQSVVAEATRIAITTNTMVRQAQVQSEFAVPREVIVTGGLTVIIAAAIIAVLHYGRRGLGGLSTALARVSYKRSSMITYGPPNNPSMALVLFDPATNMPQRIFTTENMIECNNDLTSDTDAWWKQVNVPDEMKIALLAEVQKRMHASRISAATNTPPWSGGTRYIETTTPAAALPAGDAQPVDSQWAQVPNFRQLIDGGWKPTKDRMLLGYGEHGPVYCQLRDLLSVGIVGRPNTGKTTTERFIFAQCVMVGARAIVWDLHRTVVGSFPGVDAYTSVDTIERSATTVVGELDRRITSENYEATPIMVMVDEYPLLAPNSDVTATAINRIILEGRKVNIFAMIAGQGLPAELFGGSMVRDALSSRYVLRTTQRTASIAGLEKDLASTAPDLKTGWAIVDGPVDPQRVVIPDTTRDDVRGLLTASGALSQPLPPLPATSYEVAVDGTGSGYEVAGEVAAEVDPRQEKIRSLLKAGKTNSEIIREVWQVSGGNKFTEASRELNQIIARMV